MAHKMKTHRYLIIACVCFFLAGYTVRAQAAGPATNLVTLSWTAPTNSPVPFTYEMQQCLSLSVPNPVWTTIAANIPSNQTTLSITIDRELKFWRVRSVNATNSAWASDFSNVASTLWPAAGGNLAIRLGP